MELEQIFVVLHISLQVNVLMKKRIVNNILVFFISKPSQKVHGVYVKFVKILMTTSSTRL